MKGNMLLWTEYLCQALQWVSSDTPVLVEETDSWGRFCKREARVHREYIRDPPRLLWRRQHLGWVFKDVLGQPNWSPRVDGLREGDSERTESTSRQSRFQKCLAKNVSIHSISGLFLLFRFIITAFSSINSGQWLQWIKSNIKISPGKIHHSQLLTGERKCLKAS